MDTPESRRDEEVGTWTEQKYVDTRTQVHVDMVPSDGPGPGGTYTDSPVGEMEEVRE